MVHLKLETLRLNDEDQVVGPRNFKPTSTQICDEVVRWWKEEPVAEDLLIDTLFERLNRRRSNWSVTKDELYHALKSHNLYTNEVNELKTYDDMIQPSYLTDSDMDQVDKKLMDKVSIVDSEFGKGLIATQDVPKGGMIVHESLPLSVIPQLDKQPLVARGKCCGVCSAFTTLSSQLIIKNNLDCNSCDTIWCSKQCKKLDITHSILKHPTSRNPLCSSVDWIKFENFCLKESLYSAYAVGVLYARHALQPTSNLWEIFTSLCSVSQKVRWQASDSTNVGGTFDASSNGKLGSDVTTPTMETQWSLAFGMFSKAFPKCELNNEDFLNFTGTFNLNQTMGQVYPLTAHINHSCEPNVRYDLEPKYGIKVYARKDIKKGDQLFLTYVNPLHGVTLRRRELRVNYGFICNCARCMQEWETRQKIVNHPSNILTDSETTTTARRKSSMKMARPSLKELLENGDEFDLEIPSEVNPRRRLSVRFNSHVTLAVEEE
ncbi:unnamed protein product [Kluyveromyces dobzhanskii CBS 2104]|uniref:Histone-lysine N-methyltransferase SET5 n=1 Tax=Kluyveromyces dobzhanskii CBS 2104 TaxID=1427455 RepID=A0A0A8KZE5_9SACH|nr:unnamed protein product [Kluyveromyces dobzhanskii CBS 2104]